MINPNPVVLDTASTAFQNRVGVNITDDGVYLEGATNRVHFVGLYQNDIQIGNISSNGTYIQYNGANVLEINSYSGYTFGLRLRTNDLPNGDYTAVVYYNGAVINKNYNIPIRISLV